MVRIEPGHDESPDQSGRGFRVMSGVRTLNCRVQGSTLRRGYGVAQLPVRRLGSGGMRRANPCRTRTTSPTRRGARSGGVGARSSLGPRIVGFRVERANRPKVVGEECRVGWNADTQGAA